MAVTKDYSDSALKAMALFIKEHIKQYSRGVLEQIWVDEYNNIDIDLKGSYPHPPLNTVREYAEIGLLDYGLAPTRVDPNVLKRIEVLEKKVSEMAFLLKIKK